MLQASGTGTALRELILPPEDWQFTLRECPATTEPDVASLPAPGMGGQEACGISSRMMPPEFNAFRLR